MYILTLTNKQTNEVHTYDNVIDINAGEKLYYRFQINTLGLVDGEYDLELTKDGILVGVNTLYVGDYETYSLQYKRGDNTFIDITLNTKLEDATAEINVEKFTLLPSEGYDGFSKVEIDATPLYDVAFGDGYASGNTDGVSKGIEIQKELLESIVINENGTYTRENGYNEIVVDVPDTNGSYDEGYQAGIDYASENAGEIAAANAIVLEATELTTYYTKYSDNIVNPNPVTGIYPDGEKFYNLGVLSDIIYNTGVYINNDSIIEFWYKGDGQNTDDGWNQIINAESKSDERSLALAYSYSYTNKLRLSWGGRNYEIDWNDDVLNHLIISSNGVFLNDEKVVDIENTTFTTSVPCVINGLAFSIGRRRANGSFGMIKITTDGVENVIIPTAEGLKNITTDEMLQVVQNGGYAYINNDLVILDNLIKQVNVVPKIDVVYNGIKFGQSTFVEVPDYFKFTGGSYERMFINNQNLTTPPRVTGKVTNMNYCFQYCNNLNSLPNWDFSECYNFDSTFDSSKLVDLSEIANWNYPHTGVNWNRCFTDCNNLQKCPAIYTDSATRGSYPIFYNYSDYTYFTDFGGFIGLKNSITNNRCLPKIPNLTYESCINILNGLYDFTGNGETPTSSQGQLKVHQNFIDLVGDEISIGTNKGWTITA